MALVPDLEIYLIDSDISKELTVLIKAGYQIWIHYDTVYGMGTTETEQHGTIECLV